MLRSCTVCFETQHNKAQPGWGPWGCSEWMIQWKFLVTEWSRTSGWFKSIQTEEWACMGIRFMAKMKRKHFSLWKYYRKIKHLTYIHTAYTHRHTHTYKRLQRLIEIAISLFPNKDMGSMIFFISVCIFYIAPLLSLLLENCYFQLEEYKLEYHHAFLEAVR